MSTWREIEPWELADAEVARRRQPEQGREMRTPRRPAAAARTA